MQLDPSPAPAPGTLSALVVQALAVGGAAEPSTFHTDLLARLLGASVSRAGEVAVALDVCRGTGREAAASAIPGSAGDFADCVAHAATARTILVCLADGVVELDRAEVEVVPQPSLADEEWGRVVLPSLSGRARRAWDARAVCARALVVRCADAVGAAEAALAAAIERVTTRVQGGGPLSERQVVQHRIADMAIDLLLARDAVLDAAASADRGAPERELQRAAAYAKATAAPRCVRVTAAAHQLAGGQGILARAPFHRWYRRALVAEAAFGGSRRARERIADVLLDGPGDRPAQLANPAAST